MMDTLVGSFVQFFVAAIATFIAMWIVMPITLFFLRLIGLYTTVQEGTCHRILIGIGPLATSELQIHFAVRHIGPEAELAFIDAGERRPHGVQGEGRRATQADHNHYNT